MAYLGKTPSQAVRSRFYFTASGGETSLAPAQVTGLSFTDANYVDVSLNGVALVSGTDYTATPSTNTISSLSALTASDVVEIVVYDVFSVFGGNVNGDFNISGGDLTLGDNDALIFGDGSDFKISHNGSKTKLEDTGTGNLEIRGTNIEFYSGDGGETLAKLTDDGAAELYHNNTKRIETTSSGVDVTGNVTANGGLIVNGSGTFVNFISSSNSAYVRLQNSVATGGYIGYQNAALQLWANASYKGFQLDGTTNDISFYATNGTTQGLFWDASTQRLGLGTTSPSKVLDVRDNDATGTTTSSNRVALFATNGTGKDAHITFSNLVDSPASIGNRGALYFDYNNTERMRITSDGSVGIGTSSPPRLLSLNGSAAFINLDGGANNNQRGIEFDYNGSLIAGSLINFGGTGETALSAGESGTSGYFLTFKTNGSERLRITSGGSVGIGVSSPGRFVHLEDGADTTLHLTTSSTGSTGSDGTSLFVDGTAASLWQRENDYLRFATNNTERMRILSGGEVAIGGSGYSGQIFSLQTSSVNLGFMSTSSTTRGVMNFNDANSNVNVGFGCIGNNHVFMKDASEKMRLDSSGSLHVGKTSTGIGTAGLSLRGDVDIAQFTRSGGEPLELNRLSNDGALIIFYQDGTQEGNISVSGSTVSYNGGHLARWSQATDGNRITGLVKGTVMTNLDQMAEWTKDGVTEENEQLNCMAVSSVEGDANVAGVFVNWDDDDTDFTADMNVAMTGDMVIRIASGTTVARGDLLMSAGDGTAKPQGDDIVRSKTIAKVTSTTVSHTYDDGTYLVPCVLMAC